MKLNPKYQHLYKRAETQDEAFARLIELIRVLRKECPWDRVQTFETLRTGMVEEAYEAVDAVNKGDMDNFREELGDVLLQVVMNGIIAEEEKEFSLIDVANEECEKMIRRHPHIFSDEQSKTVDKVLEKWENVKSKEHGDSKPVSRLTDVPRALPALIRAGKVQKRTEQIGLSVKDFSGGTDDAETTIRDLLGQMGMPGEDDARYSLGKLLFTIVNVARSMNIDPEEALVSVIDNYVNDILETEMPATDN